MPSLSSLLTEVRACRLCAEHLPLGPRPVVQLHPSARILIAGQAPGRKVHETGLPFNDVSGDRLRTWLGISRAVFYDARQVAILPMGFCFLRWLKRNPWFEEELIPELQTRVLEVLTPGSKP